MNCPDIEFDIYKNWKRLDSSPPFFFFLARNEDNEEMQECKSKFQDERYGHL